MDEQEQFQELQRQIASGAQDIDLNDFAKRFAERVEGEPVSFDPEKGDWNDVENAVGYGVISVDELRSMIRSGLS